MMLVRKAAKKVLILVAGQSTKRGGGGKGLSTKEKTFFNVIFLICIRSFDHEAEGGGAKGLSGPSTKKCFFF